VVVKIKPDGVPKPPKPIADSCDWTNTSPVSMVQKEASKFDRWVLHNDVRSVGGLYRGRHHGGGVGLTVDIGLRVRTVEFYYRQELVYFCGSFS
jgi:hypothetical protein